MSLWPYLLAYVLLTLPLLLFIYASGTVSGREDL